VIAQPELRSVSLAEYWRAAASPVPLLIVGGGRWGRVWADVLATARGSGDGVAIAARTDPESVRHWLATQPRLRGTKIFASMADAMTVAPAAALIASRPADHARDANLAIEHGLHVLVEKPISPQSGDSWKLVSAAGRAGRTLAVGTEFALLPAFHATADTLGKRLREPFHMVLHWHDPAQEVRHGAAKTHHQETSLLVDLLPHAFSIFRIFHPALHLVSANLSEDGDRGRLLLGDGQGGRHEFVCDRSADARVRRLEISAGATKAVIDFATHPSKADVDGKPVALDRQMADFSSTLRLELGAFLMDITGAAVGTPLTAHVADLVRLHTELESIAIGGRS
jgi:predicted dehydrogenase